MKAARGHVSETGLVSLPSEFCKAIGLDGGGEVVIELDGPEIRMRSVEDVVARSQALTRAMLRDKPDGTVEAFLTDRRREAEQE